MGRAISMQDYVRLVRCPRCGDGRWVNGITAEDGAERIQLYCYHCRSNSVETTYYGRASEITTTAIAMAAPLIDLVAMF